jgi:transcriptional regulator with PAS, ATPase and Fis domain
MKQPKELLNIAANSSVPVLIQGESGAGKEVAARYIHDQGPRRFSPFIALNCGALAQNLIESTLEGSVKGAFTGAYSDQKGIVRAANGGTLFLDEIGELPLDAQSKFLRILQEKAVLPVGASRSIPVDFRLICATNRDLKREVAAKRFREDLFFRLNVFPVVIPPLRDREDFDEIVVDLWEGIGETARRTHFNPPKRKLSIDEIGTLSRFKWPGNVRQLKNVLQRYALLEPHGVSLMDVLREEYTAPKHEEGSSVQEKFAAGEFWGKKRAEAPEWPIIKETLELCNWNKSEASHRLGISRGCIYYQIQKHGTGVCC